MKHLFLALLFLLPFTFKGQKSDTDDLNRYLRKSSNQKKTANILLITGGGLMFTGLIVGNQGDHKGFIDSNALAGLGVFTLGVLTSVISIPFYISAHQNKKKLIKFSPTVGIIPANTAVQNNNYGAVGLTLNF